MGGGWVRESCIDVPGSPARPWVFVSYWVEPDAHVDVEVSSQPMGFA